MAMADEQNIVARILHSLGWYQDDDAAAEARLRDQERRLKALETRIAVRERADRETIAELDRLNGEDGRRATDTR